MSVLSCASVITALILVSPEAPEPLCSLEGTLVLRGPDGVQRLADFAGVYVNSRNLGQDPAGRHRMAQKGRQFDPHVLVVQAGDTVDFVNLDKEPHEVHAERNVNLFDAKRENSKELTYSKLFLDPGISQIGCRIHAAMSALIITVPNAFHAPVDPQGKWRISGLPKRPLELTFWAEGATPVTRRLTPCVSAPVQVVLESQVAVKPPADAYDGVNPQ